MDDFDLVHNRICMPLADHILEPGEANSPLFAALTEEEQDFTCMWAVESQVFNGGFCQVYFNNCGWCMRFAKRGYTRLGMSQHAALVERAMHIVKCAIARRDFDAEQPPAELEELDDPWYRIDDVASVYGPKAAFVRANRVRFPQAKFD